MEKKYVFLFNGKGWMLKIDSLDDLNDYMRMIWDIRREDLFWDIKRIREKQHPSSDMGNLCSILASIKSGDEYVEFCRIRELQHKQMTDMILKGETLYVNASGGYTIHMNKTEARYESEKLMWPVFKEDDIRVKTWPGGTHFYAYIGPVQVKQDGELKWDTEEEARQAAMAYVSKKKRLK